MPDRAPEAIVRVIDLNGHVSAIQVPEVLGFGRFTWTQGLKTVEEMHLDMVYAVTLGKSQGGEQEKG